jgi:glyoxylase-like metal-dependent hydrolase (beta-lactamase superfamily II)
MIPFVREEAVDYGESQTVSPLIRRVMARNPGPFTYRGTGTYIVGQGEVAVIDPGPDLPEHLAALQAALAGERVVQILVTHDHADHSPLARPLSQLTGAPVAGMTRPIAHSVTGPPVEAGDDDAFRPDRRIAGGETFSGPGWTLRALATPGHTANHLCFALAEENALFSGDHVMGWSTSVVVPPDGDMSDYLASLRRVQDGNYATLWPTHGPPITDPAPFLAAYIDHRLAREAQVLALLERGVGRVGDMVAILYIDVDKRLHPAAAQSLLAHLIKLVREGRAVCEGEPSLGGDFSLAHPTA